MQPRSRLILAVLASLMGLVGAARAEAVDFLLPDPSCVHIATIQFADCRLETVFRCDPSDGETRSVFREETYSYQGLVDVVISDWDSHLIKRATPDGSYVVTRSGQPDPHWSFEGLMATAQGRLSQDRSVTLNGQTGSGHIDLSFRATGEKLVLNGVTMNIFDASGTRDYPAPFGTSQSQYRIYAIPDLHLIISGETTGGTTYDPKAIPHRPVSIALPGAPDFVTTKPTFCGPNLS